MNGYHKVTTCLPEHKVRSFGWDGFLRVFMVRDIFLERSLDGNETFTVK
jgi:hypothetical protein